jgi:stage II sporulation protein D
VSAEPISRPDLAAELAEKPGGGPDAPRSGVLIVRTSVIVGAFVVLLGIFSCRELPREEDVPLAAFPGRIETAPKIRMVVRRNAGSVPMEVRGAFRVFDERGNEISNRNKKLSRLYVTYNGRHLKLGALPMVVGGDNITRMRIQPREVGSLEVGDKVYPGDVEFIGVPGRQTLHCIIHMNIEEYICGVLAGEVPVDKWHEEALKAQAVSSRTYAMYQHLKNRSKVWDFGPTGKEAQEYKPGIVRNARINRAVNMTSGQVLTWQNRVFPTYFHSSCGGHTLDSSKIFTTMAIKPLGGAPCTWCSDPKLGNKFSAWKKTMSMNSIASRLNKGAGAIPELRKLRGKGGIYALEVAEQDPAGRVTLFRVRVHYAPGSIDCWANDVRIALGTRDLPSTNCKVTTNKLSPPTRYYFEGGGWGHGVGLCQWGSLGMARAGYDYQDVLAHYFPYSRIIRMVYDRPEDAPVAGGDGESGTTRRQAPRPAGGSADKRPRG